MKKVFYKIFLTFLICSYLPLAGLFALQYWYTGNYVEKEKTEDLVHCVESVNMDELKSTNIYDAENQIYLTYIDMTKAGRKNVYFNIFRRVSGKDMMNDIDIGECKIVKLRISSITNHIYMIKRVSETEAIGGVIEVIKPEIMTGILLQIYKGYSIFAIPLIFLLTFILSRDFSQPIEVLETVSNDIANCNFRNRVKIKSKNELFRLAENINKMAENMKDNINELNKVNEKLKEELEEKQRILDGKVIFMRAIGHELKTPVAIINGYIEALQDGVIPDSEIENTYNIIYNEGLSVDKLVRNINIYLKTESGAVELVSENVNLKNFIDENMQKYKLDIEQKGINLKCELETENIKIDSKAFKIVLNNLITNAITYVDENKKMEIILKNGTLEIGNSSGELSENILKNLFDPFYKCDDSRHRKYGGTGLGLSIVKNILDFLNLKYSFTYDKVRGFAVFRINFRDKIIKNT